MAGSDWQQIVAITLVAAAAVMLLRRAAALGKNPEANGCGTGGCKSCGAGDSLSPERPLIQLEVRDPNHAIPSEPRQHHANPTRR